MHFYCRLTVDRATVPLPTLWLPAVPSRSEMLQVYVHRLRKYLGAYLVHLKGKVDAIVFSAGIGENSALIREGMVADLEVSGPLRGVAAASCQSTRFPSRMCGSTLTGCGLDLVSIVPAWLSHDAVMSQHLADLISRVTPIYLLNLH